MKRALYDRLMEARTAKRPVVLITRIDDGAQALLDGDEISGDLERDESLRESARRMRDEDRSGRVGEGYFLQVFNPPLRLLLVGAVHIAQALAPMATFAGYDVTIVDPRRAWASEERFPGLTIRDDWPDEALSALAPDRRTAVVALTHDPKLDDPALQVALASPAFYIGALGSTRTHAKRLDRLREAGIEEAALARIHGPVGLSIGARSPAEIAISILAQMTQALHGAAPLVKAEAAA